jgi:hypothetical protein
MVPKLAELMNKAVLVCLPFLHDDRQPRPYTLTGIESSGLWLESEEFASRFTPPGEERTTPRALAAFVSFAQIAYVLEATDVVTPMQNAAALAAQRELSRQRGEKETYAAEPAPTSDAEAPPQGKRRGKR